MAHAQKPDFVFRRNGRVHLNRRGASVQSTNGSRGVRISGSNAGYTMFRGSVKSTGYPLHSPVSPSLPFPCVTFQLDSTTPCSSIFIRSNLRSSCIFKIKKSCLSRKREETSRSICLQFETQLCAQFTMHFSSF
jgi:hypothetical protein